MGIIPPPRHRVVIHQFHPDNTGLTARFTTTEVVDSVTASGAPYEVDRIVTIEVPVLGFATIDRITYVIREDDRVEKEIRKERCIEPVIWCDETLTGYEENGPSDTRGSVPMSCFDWDWNIHDANLPNQGFVRLVNFQGLCRNGEPFGTKRLNE